MLATTTGLTLLKGFKAEFQSLGIFLKDEIDDFFNLGLTDYLDKQIEKFSKTKTFLYRDESVNFYDVFFPVNLIVKGSIIHTDRIIENIFDKCRFVTLIGNAGSGKTMLMKHCFLSCAGSMFKIPIVIELRHLNDYQGTIIDYIYEVTLNNKVSPNKKILERALESGNFMFLFDGYDEIFSAKKEVRTKELEEIADKYSRNYFVITSRPGAEAEVLSRFINLHVSNLSDDEIHEFIIRQLSLTDKQSLDVKIRDVIQKPENKDYIDYLRSPLILSMFILTFSQFPDLPRSKNKFYYNVFETLITKHDSLTKKGGFQHERKTGLQNEDIETIIKWFSYISLFRGEYSFDRQYLYGTLKDIKTKLNLDFNIDHLIEDLTISVSLIVVDGQEYKFPHKSFQEYFCASLIRDLDFESKKTIYTKKFPENLSPLNEIANFLGLCAELDKRNFYSLFLIPQIEKIISNLSDNVRDEIDLVFNFINYFSFYITFKFGDDGFIEPTFYTTNVQLQTTILAYATLNKNGFRLIFSHVKKQQIPNAVLQHLIDTEIAFTSSRRSGSNFEVKFKDHFDKELLVQFLTSLDLYGYVREIIGSLQEKVENLNQEILTEKAQTEELLDF